MQNTRIKLDHIINHAFNLNATDIHLTVGSKPAIRQHSVIIKIENMDVITPDFTHKVSELYLSNDKKKVLEENGEVDTSLSIQGLGRYRINVFKQRGSYAIAIRQQPFNIPRYDELGLPETVRDFTQLTNGLVLVTGPTGSGKSTTLASMIDMINATRSAHIITIEDPIEYLHKHKRSIVNQREVGSDSHSFSSALRASLREDPDVILVGEMRDLETMQTALTAAETGHLVFSTLHTIGASKTVDRIIDAFPSTQQNQIRNQLATVLAGVVSQQLITRKDRKGLVLATELLKTNPAARNLIREGKSYQLNNILQTGNSSGMHTMENSLSNLYSRGLITREQMITRSSTMKNK